MSHAAQNALVAVSQWIDDSPENAARDPEALLWHRVAKVGEESGEAIAALIGFTGGNPRKGYSHDVDKLERELLDTAMAALGAIEHLHGNRGDALVRLDRHIMEIADRAGVL